MDMQLHVNHPNNRNKVVRSNERVTYDGVDYFLHDCVMFYRAGETETYIGKIVEIIDTADRRKELKVVWFFRPSEIRNYLRDYEPRWNEIFLASGVGRGLSSTYMLEAVTGKCTVVCISKDQRNHPPSEAEVRCADYVFSRTFDVGKLRIFRAFPEAIDGFKVETFFNRRKDRYLSFSPIDEPKSTCPTGNSSSLLNQKLDEVTDAAIDDQTYDEAEDDYDQDLVAKGPQAGLTEVRCSINENLAVKPEHIQEDKMRERFSVGVVKENNKQSFSERFPFSSLTKLKQKKKVKFSEEVKIEGIQNRDQEPLEPPSLHLVKDRRTNSWLPKQDQATKTENNAVTTQGSCKLPVPQQNKKLSALNRERGHWFKKSVAVISWKEKLEEAQEQGTLVFLDYLDPTYSSSEVEEMILSAFNERAEAKMIVKTPFCCQLYGKAFVIFRSKQAADTVITKLNRGCLMLAGTRPVYGKVGTIRKPMESKKLSGHYRIWPKRLTEDMVILL